MQKLLLALTVSFRIFFCQPFNIYGISLILWGFENASFPQLTWLDIQNNRFNCDYVKALMAKITNRDILIQIGNIRSASICDKTIVLDRLLGSFDFWIVSRNIQIQIYFILYWSIVQLTNQLIYVFLSKIKFVRHSTHLYIFYKCYTELYKWKINHFSKIQKSFNWLPERINCLPISISCKY